VQEYGLPVYAPPGQLTLNVGVAGLMVIEPVPVHGLWLLSPVQLRASVVLPGTLVTEAEVQVPTPPVIVQL
jgi:hypothetical protein